LLLNWLYRRADFIVPNSKTQTDFIVSHKPQLQPKLHNIHNYTDLQQFETSDIPADLSIIKIAIFARYSAQKNPVGLAKAIFELKKRTTHRFEVHWYGAQKNENGNYNNEFLYFKKTIDELNIRDVLLLYPPVKDPASLMGNYHAVCLASLYEGFSNSIAEGICCGKPMIVSDVSDNSQMVHNGENGFLFDPKRTDSIVEAFMRFLSLSHDEMCRMGQRSREIAENLFDKKHFVQQYVDLIES
jgi:glycosyltransferase involved in cell wall biosynthesis